MLNRYLLVVALAFVLVSCASTAGISRSGSVSTTASAENASIVVPGGELSFQNVSAKIEGRRSYGIYLPESAALTGSVTNNSDHVFSSVTFNLVAFDSTSVRVGDAMGFLLDRFAPGATLQLAADQVPGLGQLGEHSPTRLEVQNVSVSFPVAYSFEMVAPNESESLTYSDDNLEIAFAITQEDIGFALRNVSDEPIRIDWDEMSYVDPTGSSHRVMHQGIKYNERENPQAPMTVPPGARIEDVLQRTDMVRFVSTGSRSEWVEDDLFPGGEAALRTEGQEFSVFMPLLIGGEMMNYNFRFRVSDVDYQRS